MSRIENLKRLIESNPHDALALYALALEYKSRGECARALELLEQLLTLDPDHVAGYFQKALVHLELSQNREARRTLEAGIGRAAESGHLHARDKMRELLEKLK